MKLKSKILILIFSFLLISCSSLESSKKEPVKTYNIESQKQEEVSEELAILYGKNDPLGPMNRRIYYFNGMADRYVLKPTITKYKYYTPNFFQERVSNFFNNFEDISTTLNSFLQLKFTQGFESALRFGINSTVGILGLFDPATKLGIPKYKENLGMTLGYYGVGRGTYIVAPFLGPTNVRDLSGLAVNSYVIGELDVYHPVHIDFSQWYMTALYGFSTKVDTGIYFMETDYVFEYEYMRLLSKKYNDFLERTNKKK